MKIRMFRIPSREARAHLDLLSRRSLDLFDGEAFATAERALAEIRRGADRALARWRRRYDGVAGPPNYNISEDAEVTVLHWKEQKTVVNHAYAKGKLDKAAVKEVVESTSKILE